MIHEHSRYTSVRDKYWNFKDGVSAWDKYRKMAHSAGRWTDYILWENLAQILRGIGVDDSFV